MNSKVTRERIRWESAAWVVRLDGGTDADRHLFAAWRAQSIQHDLAFEREYATWQRLERLASMNTPVRDRRSHRSAAIRRFVTRRILRSGRWFAAAAAAVAALALPVMLVHGDPAYATGIGETRLLTLADHSRVQLNTDSAIVIHFSKSRRSIELVKGEMFVDIDPGDARPFSVSTPSGDVVPQGRRTNVRVGADGLVVDALDGTVRVSNGGRLAVLVAGKRGRFDAGRARVAAIDPVQTLAWRQGAIDLRGQTLQEAANEFNRYNELRIVISDPSVGSYRLGGYFQTSDVTGFVRSVETAFPVTARRSDDAILLTRRAAR